MTKLTEAQRKEIRDKVQNELLNQPVQMGQEFINDFFWKENHYYLEALQISTEAKAYSNGVRDGKRESNKIWLEQIEKYGEDWGNYYIKVKISKDLITSLKQEIEK